MNSGLVQMRNSTLLKAGSDTTYSYSDTKKATK